MQLCVASISMELVCYSVDTPLSDLEAVVSATAPDSKCKLTVDGKSPGEATQLSIGDTRVEICVGSIDGSSTKVKPHD